MLACTLFHEQDKGSNLFINLSGERHCESKLGQVLVQASQFAFLANHFVINTINLTFNFK